MLTDFFKKNYEALIVSVWLLSCLIIAPLDAAGPLKDAGEAGRQANQLKQSAGFANLNIGGLLKPIISAFLGLLGIIFVILLILAGYDWLTAQGEDEKVTKAKNTITRAIIGLLIVIAAYAITVFVFSNLPGGGGGGGNGNGGGPSGPGWGEM